MMNLPMNYDAYCFDLDGTIYIGSELLPGVKETIYELRKHGKKILFITNSPTITRKEGKERLERLGIETSLEEVLTAPYVAGTYFAENEPDASVFIIGERAIHTELENFEIETTEEPLTATHVLVGLDKEFTYQNLHLAMKAVRHCKKLIVTNPDPSGPAQGGIIPDTLALARAIEVASDHKINQNIGKPDPYYANIMLEKLGVPADRILVVGDRIETDIELGMRNGFKTCLVLTGIATMEDVRNSGVQPDYIVERLADAEKQVV